MKTASTIADVHTNADGAVYPDFLTLSPDEGFAMPSQIKARQRAERADAKSAAHWPMGWTIWLAILASALIWGAIAIVIKLV